MTSQHKLLCATFALTTFLSTQAIACDVCHEEKAAHFHFSSSADSHAPLGVMGDHMHKKNEWMVSYRFMRMDMAGNRDGTDSLSPDEIVTSTPNRFFGTPGQPPTLRVVPTEMTMDMHMFGVMYAPTDWLTIMAMANYLDKEMDHITFQGGTGTNRLGTFTTNSKGWGDTKVSGLFRLYQDKMHHIHLNAGLSLPTGSIDETDTVLAPNNTTPNLRLPYAMQLGTGTFDLHPGITYNGRAKQWTWGAQYSAEIRLEDENNEGYSWGNKHLITSWGAYGWSDSFSTSLRFSASTQDSIDGIDPNIVAPVQTADPDNFGGDIIDIGLGANYSFTSGMLKGNRLAVEATLPVYRDLNGPQMETDFILIAGWQYAF